MTKLCPNGSWYHLVYLTHQPSLFYRVEILMACLLRGRRRDVSGVRLDWLKAHEVLYCIMLGVNIRAYPTVYARIFTVTPNQLSCRPASFIHSIQSIHPSNNTSHTKPCVELLCSFLSCCKCSGAHTQSCVTPTRRYNREWRPRRVPRYCR